jgi:hypothetical protein
MQLVANLSFLMYQVYSLHTGLLAYYVILEKKIDHKFGQENMRYMPQK